MSGNQIEGNWKRHQGKAAEKWGKLTSDDLNETEGKREHLEAKLQEAYGVSKGQAKKDVDEFCKSL